MNMKKWSKALIVGFSLLFIISCVFGQLENQNTWYEARVTSVIDGDTIQVHFIDEILPAGCERNERVRFIGVDTPELFTTPPEYFAQEARDYTNQFYQKTVMLEFDTVTALRDRYGRLLAYVYYDIGVMPINKQLIAGGYGYYYGVFAFEAERMTEFKNAENYARSNKNGLWN